MLYGNKRHMLRLLFSGRMGRKNYLLGFLLYTVVIILTQLLISEGSGIHLLLAKVGIIWFVAFISISMFIRRLHDLGRSGWWYLLNFVPLVNIIFFFYVALKAGEKSTNEYGSVPPGNVHFLLDMFKFVE